MITDYRKTMRNVFLERRERNASYSLRAYARDLGVHASNLYLVLKKEKGINLSTARQIAGRLGLSENEQSLFCKLVEKEHARSPVARMKASEEIEKSSTLQSNLTLKMMEVMSSWH